MEKKVYASFDYMKIIMALFIMWAHTANEWAHLQGVGHYVLSIYNFGVPFFFCCSAFLFFSKIRNMEKQDQNSYYKQWSFRIGKMYLVWSLIYFCFVLVNWIITSADFENEILPYFHRALVFTTYSTIWFLPSLWVGVSIVYLLNKWLGKRAMYVIVFLLYVVGCLCYNYTSLVCRIPFVEKFVEAYLKCFHTFRNGVFNAAPCAYLGFVLANKNTLPIKKQYCFSLMILFAIGFIGEGMIVKRNNWANNIDMGFLMMPTIYFMMAWLMQLDVKPTKLSMRFRNWSMIIFLGQRLFLSAIPSVIPGLKESIVSSCPPLLIMCMFTVVIFGFAVIMEALSKKYEILKILW